MPRQARVHYVPLKSSLVNLPISIYGPLLERGTRPQGLVVHLTRSASGNREKSEAYVGWTGMASASSLAHFQSGAQGLETIEIDPQFAQDLGFLAGDTVEIGLLQDLSVAKSVGTEPVSSDDWEIIEIHADHVESTLLSQVRVAAIGQEINVWVLGRTRVRLRVVSLDPSNNSSALLLSTDTEVSIAPKLHSSKRKDAETVHDPAADKPPPTQSAVLRVLPPRLFQTLPTYSGAETIVFVSTSIYTVLYPAVKSSPTSKSASRCNINRLTPPQSPVDKTSGSSEDAKLPKILNPTEGAEVLENAAAIPMNAYVFASSEIPPNHVVFINPANEVKDWDRVKLTTTSGAWSGVSLSKSENPVLDKVVAFSSSLQGVEKLLKRGRDFCITTLEVHSINNFVRGASGLLVTGSAGSGKTSLARAISQGLQEDARYFAYVHYVDVSEYSNTPIPSITPLFQYWYDLATWHRPTILVLDNLHTLLSAEVEHADSTRARQITERFLSIYSKSARMGSQDMRDLVIIATAPSKEALHPVLFTLHQFRETISIKPPDKDSRRDILSRIVRDKTQLATVRTENLNFVYLATQTEGYLATDLHDLVSRALQFAIVRNESGSEGATDDTTLSLLLEDFETAQKDFVPMSLREVKLQKSDVSWEDVGGLHETRRVLRETLEWPTKYAQIFAQSPLRLRSGLLLYGYPGCGKTLLASAAAKECGLNFISVKGPEILNKYIGASEKTVRDLFERASSAKPCVLFFDEFDSIAPKRGHDSTGVTDRVVNQLLTQMDGAEGLDGVYVLAATSRPDLIDSALLRPGRLDKSLLCEMPGEAERRDILVAVTRKMTISSSVDFDEIAAQTEGFSGADLQALVYNANLEAVHSLLDVQHEEKPLTRDTTSNDELIPYVVFGGGAKSKAPRTRAEEADYQRRLRTIASAHLRTVSHSPEIVPPSKPPHEITQENLRSVLKTTRPSVPESERLRLDQIYAAFIGDRSGDMPAPPESGGVGHRVSLM